MKNQYLPLIIVAILSLLHINCSKKNAIGAENGSSNTITASILPSPAVVNGDITIKGKKLPSQATIKFIGDNEDFYSFSVSKTGDSLKFSLSDGGNTLSMGEYQVNILNEKNEIIYTIDKYYILDEETFKTTPLITNITPNPFDIGSNGAIKIDGKNFSKTGTTVILTNKADNNDIKELKGSDITVDDRGSSITFRIASDDSKVIPDVKNKATYKITVIVENKNIKPAADIEIINTNYPVITNIQYESDGTHLTLSGKGWTKGNIFYKNKTDGTSKPINNNLGGTNEVYIPTNIASGDDYYLVVKQGSMELLVTNQSTGATGNNFSVKPYITRIDAIIDPNTNGGVIPFDYPSDFTNTDSIVAVNIQGNNLLGSDTKPSFTLTANGVSTGITATSSQSTSIKYGEFSKEVAQAGDINIVCNDATNHTKTIAFYKPVVTNVSPTQTTTTTTITGRGFVANGIEIVFYKGTTPLKAITTSSTDGTTISLNVSGLGAGSYDSMKVRVATNISSSKYEFTPAFKVNPGGTPDINEIRTVALMPLKGVTIQFIGENLTNDTKIVFFKEDGVGFTKYTETGYNGTQTHLDNNVIQLTLTPISGGMAVPTLYFNLDTSTDNSIPKYVWTDEKGDNVPVKFACIKNAVMGWGGTNGTQSSVFSQSYFKDAITYPTPYLELLGDELLAFANTIEVKTSDGTLIQFRNGGITDGPLTTNIVSNISANRLVLLRTATNYVPPLGVALFTYKTPTDVGVFNKKYIVTMPFYITP